MTSAVTDRMEGLLARWGMDDDPRAGFLRCYRLMTGNMLAALEDGTFGDPVWVRVLLERFAAYYFDALDAYDTRPTATPEVWRFAHECTMANRLFVVQRLLLGINAHINYDLVLTLVDVLRDEWTDAPAGLRERRYADHCAVNRVIGRSIDVVQDTIIEPEEPLMQLVDVLMGPADEWMLSRLIAAWREDVWRQAVRMLDAGDDADCEQIRRALEAATLRRAHRILRYAG
ncbi:MAG: DUF5995 family protein [Rhodothermales bacterium]